MRVPRHRRLEKPRPRRQTAERAGGKRVAAGVVEAGAAAGGISWPVRLWHQSLCRFGGPHGSRSAGSGGLPTRGELGDDPARLTLPARVRWQAKQRERLESGREAGSSQAVVADAPQALAPLLRRDANVRHGQWMHGVWGALAPRRWRIGRRAGQVRRERAGIDAPAYNETEWWECLKPRTQEL